MTVLWTVGILGLNFWSRLKHFVKFVARNVAWEFLFIPIFFHLDWLFKEKERFPHILYYDAVKASEKKNICQSVFLKQNIFVDWDIWEEPIARENLDEDSSETATFTCSKATIETLEKSLEYVQS